MPSRALSEVLRERQVMNARELADLPVYQAREVPWLIDASRAIPNAHGLPADNIEVSQVNVPLVNGSAYGPLKGAVCFRPKAGEEHARHPLLPWGHVGDGGQRRL